MVSRLSFDFPNPPLRKNPKILLKDFPFTLPEKYLCLLKKHDGGRLDYTFDYYDNFLKRNFGSCIGVLFGIACDDMYNLITRYNELPQFFPKKLVPFGEDGGGDFVCFDYRKTPTINNPPIVYWSHEGETGNETSFLAKDFEEFVSMLREPEVRLEYDEKRFEKWLSNIPGRSA